MPYPTDEPDLPRDSAAAGPAWAPPPPPPPSLEARALPRSLRELPTEVTLAAMVLAVAALAAALAGLGYLAVDAESVGVVLLLVAAAHAVGAYGLLRREAWGWWIAAVGAVAAVLVHVVGLYTGDVPTFLLGLVLAVVALALLLAPDVRAYAGVRLRDEPHEGPRAPG